MYICCLPATEIAVMVSAFFLIQWETLICLEPTLKATVTLPLLLVSGEHLTVLPFLTAFTSPLYLEWDCLGLLLT